MYHYTGIVMKRVYFTQINNIISDAVFLPLSVGYIWEYCRSQPDIAAEWTLGGIQFERHSVDEYLQVIQNPDVVGISCYVWNWQISIKLAHALKEKYPQCMVVLGGPQVPFRIDWFQQNKHICDAIVTYGGERAFAEILRGNLDAPGIISNYGYKPNRPDKEINDIPSPYLSGLFDNYLQEGKSYSAIIETNRGCPYRCTFCDQEALYYNKLSRFHEHRVYSEIDWMVKNKIEFVYFADSNLGILERDIDFIDYIAEKKKETGYPRQIDYSTAKQQPERITEIGRILNHKAGIKRGVTIALQSMNPDTLKAIHRVNIANEQLEETVARYKSAGVDNYCELILGLPEESLESWIAGIGKILELGSDHALTVHPLSIVPNTPFSNPSYQQKYGLQYTPTPAPAGGNTYPEDSDGEIDYICHASKTMTTQDWIDAYFYAKGIVIPHHYHGVTQVAAEYLKREHNIPLTGFYQLLFQYSMQEGNVLNTDRQKHIESVRQSLFHNKTWGRPIDSSSNFHIQDNGATASYLYANVEMVHKQVKALILREWDIDISEPLRFNRHILDTVEAKETVQNFEHNWCAWFFNQKPLCKGKYCVTVSPKQYKDPVDHAKHLFWYGRKSKRCFLKAREIKYD